MEISGFENIICIEEFCYRQRVDKHEECRFSVLVPEENVGACTAQLEKTCTMKDTADENGFHFTGTVTSVAVTRWLDCCRVEVIVLGKTLQYDREPQSRVFQSETKTVSAILQKLGLSGINCSGESDQTLTAMLVQDHETDWQFLTRLAAYVGKHLFPGEKMWFGDPMQETQNLDDIDILELRVELNSRQSNAVCRTSKQKPLKLGIRTQLYGKNFFVDGVAYQKYREEYRYEYHLSESVKTPETTRLPLYVLSAKVTENTDPENRGRVKLAFQDHEDAMGDAWVPCGSLWASGGLGIACVPWKDDTVDVRILNGEPLVTLSRREKAFDERFRSPDSRYLFAGKDTWFRIDNDEIAAENSVYTLTITKDQFELLFGKDLSIVVEDGKCIAYVGKTDMELTKEAAKITASKVEIKGSNGVSIN